VDSIAAEIGLSSRTLQRRLAEEGTSLRVWSVDIALTSWTNVEGSQDQNDRDRP